VGGIVFFAWINWSKLIASLAKMTISIKHLAKTLIQAMFLLGIFLIPIIIILLNWLFNPPN
jgi:hypothetical protein